MFTVKNYKTLSSGAYTATIYREGKRWALVEDDGRGGQPNVYPLKTDEHYGKYRQKIMTELGDWAATALPDWYLTEFGEHEALTPNWELAIGYIIDCYDFNRAAKKGTLLRDADNNYYTTSSAAYAKTTGWTGWEWTGWDWIDHR